MSMYCLFKRREEVFHLGDESNVIDVMTWRKSTRIHFEGITKSKGRGPDGFLDKNASNPSMSNSKVNTSQINKV